MPWYKTIDPIKELTILGKRSNLERQQMYDQPPIRYKELEKTPKSFTKLSAFQYLATGVNQKLFTWYKGKSKIGIILKPYTNPRLVYWRDSNRTDVSDSIFRTRLSKETFKLELQQKQFIITTENDVRDKVVNRFQNMQQLYKKDNLSIKDAKILWTEGLFRYQLEEIDGVVINVKNLNSCVHGYVFAKVIEKESGNKVPFYALSTTGCIREKVDIKTLSSTLEKADPKKLEQVAKKLYKEYRDAYTGQGK